MFNYMDYNSDRYRLRETHGETAGQTAVLYTGIAFACMAIATSVIQFGYISRFKPDPRRLLPIGLTIVFLGYIAADAFHAFPVLCAAFLTIGAGSALAIPSANALGSLSVSREEQGAAAALMSAAPPSGFIFGPLIGAGLYQVDHALPLIASAILMACLAAYAYFVTARKTPSGA